MYFGRSAVISDIVLSCLNQSHITVLMTLVILHIFNCRCLWCNPGIGYKWLQIGAIAPVFPYPFLPPAARTNITTHHSSPAQNSVQDMLRGLGPSRTIWWLWSYYTELAGIYSMKSHMCMTLMAIFKIELVCCPLSPRGNDRLLWVSQ